MCTTEDDDDDDIIIFPCRFPCGFWFEFERWKGETGSGSKLTQSNKLDLSVFMGVV